MAKSAFIIAASISVFSLGLDEMRVQAAEPSGIVVASIPSTRARSVTGERVLHASSEIFMGDSVVTGSRGEAQIRLSDNTRLVVGPRSILLIDEFVVSRNGSVDKVTINAVRGAFRFISGSSRKAAYTIKTPTATIGIRGTELDFTVEPGGKTNVALLSGALQLCDNRRRCIRLEDECSIAEIEPRRRPERMEPADLNLNQIGEIFPYIRSQSRLWRDFRVSATSSCGVRRALRRINPIITGSVVNPAIIPPPPPGEDPPPPPGEDPPPPDDDPPPPDGDSPGGNKGSGNGGDSIEEGDNEQQNPGGINGPPGRNK